MFSFLRFSNEVIKKLSYLCFRMVMCIFSSWHKYSIFLFHVLFYFFLFIASVGGKKEVPFIIYYSGRHHLFKKNKVPCIVAHNTIPMMF